MVWCQAGVLAGCISDCWCYRTLICHCNTSASTQSTVGMIGVLCANDAGA